MNHPNNSQHAITELLLDWGNRDEAALEKLMPLVYEELRWQAHRYMERENSNHTLQTSALVNEAYLRLVNQKNTRWQNRAQFFGLSAQLMRRILVYHARSHTYAKRGGRATHFQLDEAAALSPECAPDVLSLNDALTQLSTIDPRKCLGQKSKRQQVS